MRRRLGLYIVLAGAAILIVTAALSWFAYMANGIAYGSLKGLPGRETALNELRSRSAVALGLAVSSEALAVAAASWLLIAGRMQWVTRLWMSLAIAGMADVFTFALVRGL